jgi:hypothetical protein
MPFAWQVEGGVVIGTNRFLTAAYDLLPGAASDAGIHMQVGTNLLIESSADMIPVDESVVDGAVRRRVRSDQPLGARSREFLRMMVEPE